jgi:hypothetical protein
MNPLKYVVKCKKCHQPMTIIEVCFTKGTEILFWVVCIKCNIETEHHADFFKIQAEIYRKLETTYIEGNESVN